MYALFGIYLIIPVLSGIKNRVADKEFLLFSVLAMIAGISYYYSTSSEIRYGIASMEYTGYVMLGSWLYTRKESFRKYAILRICLGVFCIYIPPILMLISMGSVSGIGDFSAQTIVGSVLIFTGFLGLKDVVNTLMRIKIQRLSEYTFYIYILHAGVKDILYRIQCHLYNKPNPVWYIPLFSLVVFLISLIGAVIIKKMCFRIKGAR